MWPLPFIHSPSQSLSQRVDSLHGPSSTTFISTNHLIRALTQTYTHTHTLPGHVWHREKPLSNSKTNSAHSSCHYFTRGMATLLIQFMVAKFIFLRNRTNEWLYSREASASQQNNNANQILLSTFWVYDLSMRTEGRHRCTAYLSVSPCANSILIYAILSH